MSVRLDNTKGKPGFSGKVIAIGASAGGLEALEHFFVNCPMEADVAYVVIQHLSPDHKSIMDNLLGRYTSMPIKVVEEGMVISNNEVYLIPAGTIMRIKDRQFNLTPKIPHELTLPIDIFLKSLAEEAGNCSIAVILSGTGTDGTRGSVAINAAGGLVLAQDPDEAKFDGMPRSVINTGLVDAILPANELAARIVQHLDNAPVVLLDTDDNRAYTPLDVDDAKDEILELLYHASGTDFSEYKTATVYRRLERRMQVRNAASLDNYLEILREDRTELYSLKREILIPVTSFFRDVEAFQALQQNVIKEIVEKSGKNEKIRVWIAATSTGEEAYSIAMMFMETFEQQRKWPDLKIFATDVNNENIDFASQGEYPQSAAAELTGERLERFFDYTGQTYKVKPELRHCIVFAKHNLLSDPPFTQMDLVSCRNALIYFKQEAQKKALYRMKYALKPEGVLFLGSSESLAGLSDSFKVIHARYKIFSKKINADSSGYDLSSSRANDYRRDASSRTSTISKPRSLSDKSRVDEAVKSLLANYAAPAMLVNQRYEIIHLFGELEPFIRPREGNASLTLQRLLPEELVASASALVFKVSRDQKEAATTDVSFTQSSGPGSKVRLRAIPLVNDETEVLMLLCFESYARLDAVSTSEKVDVGTEIMNRVAALESELTFTRESLQSTIEQLETSNEELQATNEELMASNEELQSSNEELQSVNEELNTVNAEYQANVLIMNQANADLAGMLESVGVPIVVVGQDMAVTRFSPEARDVFRLRSSDIGRPLGEVANDLKYPDLIHDIEGVLTEVKPCVKQVSASDGREYLARLMPYSYSTAPVSHGMVATFVDITALSTSRRLQSTLDAIPESMAVLHGDGSIAIINQTWKQFAMDNGNPALLNSGIGDNYLESCTASNDKDAARARLGVTEVLNGVRQQFSYEYPCHSETEKRWFVMNVAPVKGVADLAVVVTHVNITEFRKNYPSGEEQDG